MGADMSLSATVRLSGPIFGQGITPEQALARGMAEAVDSLADGVRQRIPRGGPGRYGHLSDSIRASVSLAGSRVIGRVFPRGRAAFRMSFIESGTRAHEIMPRSGRRRRRRGGVLAIDTGGMILLRPRARHPGMAGQSPLQTTLAEQASAIQDMLGEYVARALREGSV
jgi:hypothetical protein